MTTQAETLAPHFAAIAHQLGRIADTLETRNASQAREDRFSGPNSPDPVPTPTWTTASAIADVLYDHILDEEARGTGCSCGWRAPIESDADGEFIQWTEHTAGLIAGCCHPNPARARCRVKLTDGQRAELAKELAANWRNMHTNESLGRQRMLADSIAPLIESWLADTPAGWNAREEYRWGQKGAPGRSMTLTEDQIHAILDTARFGDRITITRSNGGDLTATITGPALAAPDLDPAVGIDLLNGESHVIRSEDGHVWGQIVDLRVEVRS